LSLLAQAVAAVRQNPSAFLVYLGITVAVTLVQVLSGGLIGKPSSEDLDENLWLRAYAFINYLATAAAYAAASSIGFARLGKEIDRPLWKISGDWDALRRFFVLWFFLILTLIATSRLLEWTAGPSPESPPSAFPLLLYFVFAAALVPFGACVMFYGTLDWTKLGEILAPLKRQFAAAFGAFLFAGFQSFYVFLLSGLAELGKEADAFRWYLIPIEVIDAACTFIVFAWTWLICIADRNQGGERDVDFFS